MTSLKGFVKLRRGILDHIPGMSPQVLKLFIVLLLLAEPMGASRGVVRASVNDLASAANMRRQTLLKAADQLAAMGWIEISKARNQHAVTAWRIVKYDAFAGAEYGTGKPSAGAEGVTSNSPVVVTEVAPALNESGTSNRSNRLKPFKLQAPKNKKNIYARKERASSGDELQPWAVCEAIAEAGGLEFVKPNGRSLKEAKSLLQSCPELTGEDVRSITQDLIAADGGKFWNVKAPVTPAAVERHLPLWRKRRDQPRVQTSAENAPIDLASAWAQEVRQ